MKNTANNNNVINSFIINVSLISPIEEIISKFNNLEFRDCDIKWLDTKLAAFTEFGCKTLGMNTPMAILDSNKILNDYTKGQYIERFNILLSYFKSLNN